MFHKIHWTPQKIAQRINLIRPLIYRQKKLLPAFHYKPLSDPLEQPPTGIDVDVRDWPVIQPNTYWGTWRTDFVMRTDFDVPESMQGDADVMLYLPLGNAGDFSHPESLIYIDGTPYASADRHHQEVLIPPQYRDGQTHTLALHGWTGIGEGARGEPGIQLHMRECAVVQVDQPTRDFVAAARVALDIAGRLDDNDPVKGRLYNALDAAFKVLDTRDPLGTAAFYDSVPAALETLKDGIAKAGPPLDVDILAIGHAHIDVAWLWTLGQTVRKSGRTFSNVLRLMEQFPEYTFSQSQAQLYQYTEEYYPEIFAQIEKRVAEGRWEVMGGTWVEPDCNAIGAESLARQFLLGRGYFRRHFGDVDTPVLWLPDTFGYSWALPQLIKQAGMKYFITHKMSWNQMNQMPHQFLWWQGLDGTRVLTHFLTTPTGDQFLPFSTTYNGNLSAKEIIGTWTNFRQKETYNELITAYGFGDGGGGPTREMIENVEQLACHPGAPRVRPGTIREFMDRVEEKIGDGLPVWNGEFYLEYHRGTFTSQARNKRNNRKSEFLLHDAEFLSAFAAQITDYEYPAADLSKAWETVCLNQFHDILPGSSIGEVYVDSARDYALVRELGVKAREGALNALAKTLPEGSTILVANPTAFTGRRVGMYDGTLNDGMHLEDLSGRPLLTQAVEGGTLIEIPNVAPYSITALSEAPGAAPEADDVPSVSEENGGYVLENIFLRVEIGANGDLTSVFDKQVGREVLAPGQVGNALLAFEDRPMNFDAWDIDIYYEDRTEKIEGIDRITITEKGPLRAALKIERTYRSSKIVQTISIQTESKRIDFDTWVDWHEHHILLKTAFPVDILSPFATFDVQWGNVQRATHRNTSWEMARFETCAHKWADLSEGGYGVALLNDCKYGYDVLDNVMRLTLLKSATSPDPNADQGEHLMTYSLLPHIGDWRRKVVQDAYDLNDPVILRSVSGGGEGTFVQSSMVTVDAWYVIIETIKRAEDGNGWIVRLYEDKRRRGPFVLRAGFDVARAAICNLLEEDETPLEMINNSVQLDISPYQIMTIRLVPKE